jgi:hypothetical protein
MNKKNRNKIKRLKITSIKSIFENIYRITTYQILHIKIHFSNQHLDVDPTRPKQSQIVTNEEKMSSFTNETQHNKFSKLKYKNYLIRCIFLIYSLTLSISISI